MIPIEINYLKDQVKELDELLNDETYYSTTIAKTTLHRLLRNMQQAIDMLERDLDELNENGKN